VSSFHSSYVRTRVHGSGQCSVDHQRCDRLEVKLPILCRLCTPAPSIWPFGPPSPMAVAARVAELIGD